MYSTLFTPWLLLARRAWLRFNRVAPEQTPPAKYERTRRWNAEAIAFSPKLPYRVWFTTGYLGEDMVLRSVEIRTPTPHAALAYPKLLPYPNVNVCYARNLHSGTVVCHRDLV